VFEAAGPSAECFASFKGPFKLGFFELGPAHSPRTRHDWFITNQEQVAPAKMLNYKRFCFRSGNDIFTNGRLHENLSPNTLVPAKVKSAKSRVLRLRSSLLSQETEQVNEQFCISCIFGVLAASDGDDHGSKSLPKGSNPPESRRMVFLLHTI
jgi:hypothetical protein